MSPTIEERTQALLDGGATGDELADGLQALDAERAEAAGPIFPDEGDMDPDSARDIAQRFRTLRDEHRGEKVVPRAVLPDAPGRVAAALIAVAIQVLT